MGPDSASSAVIGSGGQRDMLLSAGMVSRRHFLTASTAALVSTQLRAQTARIDVAAVEHDRILADVKKLGNPATPIDLSQAVATLTAAFLLTKDAHYATQTVPHLKALTALKLGSDVLPLIPLAEAAVALRFLTDALPEDALDGINSYFTDIQKHLSADRDMRLARDTHDHRASAWLLVSSAIARYQRDDRVLDANRALFRKPTLRNQIRADGTFPEELATPNPYRNTLFNFDLLTGVCQLLASPFDLLWEYELGDGPGMRSVSAFIYPVIKDRNKWPAVSDLQHFHELPGRRQGLLFAGRAYNRPEYVELWRSLPAEIPAALGDTFPIREPVLWNTRAPHGL